ncbi:cytochrome P450 [Trichosporon asahii var. asahii CBS 2479]|uniref:Iron-sulfur assembly protein 1 n=1 Tax=Trichosporon asahii var. asahii (strain ATCC 90039 / CBS 2479 / JCM 2466 / KCTC 7840 / NBRC 103889/ NCYC 2677 / UAMH 7654) TaxID=1186058 RepID=J6F249_TRIAS|nr:cytochrome P450 [Trichosporon asahii var. asahii CBS 2479]EJT49272.1 cytochrome P450 [Trichosporon asahii var. asahii CBS 2479]
MSDPHNDKNDQNGGGEVAKTAEGTTPIPQPKETIFLGNLLDLDLNDKMGSLCRLAALYGEIYQLKLKEYVVFLSSQRLVHYICNEQKYHKFISQPLKEVRAFAGDGLFTSYTGEHNWELAHRILVPAFSPVAIRKMQPMMCDVITQMLMFWEHHAGQPFEAADQYTRLTFNRSSRPDLIQAIMLGSEREYREDTKELWRQCDEIVAERRRHPDPEAHDLLNNMILDKDPKTGEHLSDENIRFQMVTFLIAGHETTSGLLSFATYYMLKHPNIFQKAREEADRVIAEAGGNLLKINPSHLTYIEALLKESLRLQPTAPAWAVTPVSEEGDILPGGFKVNYGQSIAVLLPALGRDPDAWGPDADEFNPERWLDGREIKEDAWKPFGNGARACIGRIFAMQEAILAVALIVNRFDLTMADPEYDLAIKQTLTIKPKDFNIIAHPRKNKNQSLLSELLAGGTASTKNDKVDTASHQQSSAAVAKNGEKMYVYYGSNSGSCEGLAREVAAEAKAKGFDVTLGELDTACTSGKLPTDGPVVIVTASYEGQPTDNARIFVEALKNLPDGSEKGVKYCVMGAGHHDWAATFHRIPKFIDERIAQLGGERFMPLSLGDAGGDILEDFEDFKEKLWDHFKGSNPTPRGGVKVEAPEEDIKGGAPLSPEMKMKILRPSILTEATPNCPQTNYVTIKLPEGLQYRAGDYLAVLPKNPEPTVERALKLFNLDPNDNIVLNMPTSSLPSGVPIRIGDLLSSYVELGLPVSKRVLPKLEQFCADPLDKQRIKALEDNYTQAVTEPRLALADLLEQIPGCKPPFGFFLSTLPKMKIRQYSISSTPLKNPEEVSLTFTVHTTPSKTGKGSYLGVASNYIAFLEPGDCLNCTVKSSQEFHPPVDPAVPIVMFAAGSGIAPFRGFIEERALQKAAGREVGKTVLYFGVRTPNEIYHKDMLAEWVESGALDFRPVLSRSDATEIPGFPKDKVHTVPGCKYVQDRVAKESDDIVKLFDDGAQFYTCGSGARLGSGLKKVLLDIIKEQPRCAGKDPQQILDKLAKDRYRTDVFLLTPGRGSTNHKLSIPDRRFLRAVARPTSADPSTGSCITSTWARLLLATSSSISIVDYSPTRLLTPGLRPSSRRVDTTSDCHRPHATTATMSFPVLRNSALLARSMPRAMPMGVRFRSTAPVRAAVSSTTPSMTTPPAFLGDANAAAGPSTGIKLEASPPPPRPRRKIASKKAPLTMTPEAIKRLEALQANPAEPKFLRIGVKTRGCAGMAYHLDYVPQPGKFDEVVEQDGVRVLVDSKALFSIIGSRMDWRDTKLSAGFVFDNPNIVDTCGCGESFLSERSIVY